MLRKYEEFIASEFSSCVQNTITRLAAEDTYRPFHSALLSEQALFWSRFERSFSTSFGQRVIEKISQAAALSGGAEVATNQQATIVNLSQSQLNSIEDHITGLRTGSRLTNWNADIAAMSAAPPTGDQYQIRVISDLYWTKNGVNNYMSIKTVKPNIDQTAEAKRDLLKLKLADPTANVYYGLYYNPYGESKLDYAWSPPKNIFNFNTDPCILIGKEYWDTLGGVGFYEEVLAIAARVGIITRQQIQGLR
ncbi:TdeIII family type II restriction endonuclease [Deefgea salmonis]|uniref:type II site-specific deoxyribonuclease n=1 Tax=Deefgea salmonis TaxID=2875502 RepID=A0ABS8BKE2_9NEIS|nr:TdeIII family type II restriction endonuclease [Deefgea salmonis]MCB5196197.1 TdeIII family type II restriction endonuclease [Deefgea salmonis]